MTVPFLGSFPNIGRNERKFKALIAIVSVTEFRESEEMLLPAVNLSVDARSAHGK